MIRPLTIAAFLMACGSGLYLYQSKHEVQLLDRTIEKTVHDTGALREQSRLLAAEWTMLNDPDRLRQFSDTYLNLKTINPAQFTSLASLKDKLPAPLAEVPPPSEQQEPLSIETAPRPESESTVGVPGPVAAATADKILPVPPVPVLRPTPIIASLARAPETKVAAARAVNVEAAARPTASAGSKASEQRSAEPRTSEPRAAEYRAPEGRPPESRSAESRPTESRAIEARVAEARAGESRGAESRVPEQRSGSRAAEARADSRTPSAPAPIVLAAPRLQPVISSQTAQPVPGRSSIAQAPAGESRATQLPPIQMPSGARQPALAQSPRPNQAPASAQAPGMIPAPAPFNGSLLGMARGSMPPAPRPTPVNATYNAN